MYIHIYLYNIYLYTYIPMYAYTYMHIHTYSGLPLSRLPPSETIADGRQSGRRRPASPRCSGLTLAWTAPLKDYCAYFRLHSPSKTLTHIYIYSYICLCIYTPIYIDTYIYVYVCICIYLY